MLPVDSSGFDFFLPLKEAQKVSGDIGDSSLSFRPLRRWRQHVFRVMILKKTYVFNINNKER